MTSDDDDPFSPPAEPSIVLAVLDVIHQHVAPSTGDLVVTPDFLFSVCSVLVSNSEHSQPELLLAVLRCLRRTWRTQPSHARSLSALARNLAALPSSILVSHTAQLDGGCILSSHSLVNSTDPTLETPRRFPETPTTSSKGHIGASAFRSGCAACKRPRRSTLEPLKLAAPLHDLRTPTPRPVAPHRARRVQRTDENAPPVSTPSKVRRIYPVATAPSPVLPSPVRSSRRTPNRNVFRVKNS